ncbi:MAG: dihydrofolate reductase [Acidobacteriota bacterium]|nr:dihydrofolate reductase [Acidobacteriota bacterium]MDH3785013.1 dihydrofolate reductase [Acidobacteriota bacterium]
MIMIAAMSSDRVIGAGDRMPWAVPEEYAQFLSQVRDQCILMGRRSWEIFGADLVQSENLVLTRSDAVEGKARPVHSLDEAVTYAESRNQRLFVAGGASVYRLALPHATAMHLSTIHGDFEGDAVFPAFGPEEWTLRVERKYERYTYREFSR